MKTVIAIVALTLATGAVSAARADELCATAAQAEKVQAYYKENPAAMPVIAAKKLGVPETVVVTGLAAGQSAGTDGSAFADVWASMTQWKQALFLITKGDNVFEVVSGVAPAEPSKTSKYSNIKYDHPLRGHLRPDQYAAIYAVSIPRKDVETARGVLFYDASGASVFGAFISGEGPAPPASELAKFDELMKMIKARKPVCPAPG